MPWTTIPDGEYAEGQPVRGVTGLAMRDNVSAVANGDTGAPKIQQSALDTDCVGQSQIKTTFQSLTHSTSAATWSVLTGGAYTIGFSMQGGGSGGADPFIRYGRLGVNSSTYSFSAELSQIQNSAHDNSRSYYINSSPPYDLGDGEIPLFVYLLINNSSGDIELLQTMVDPIWAYNGPTDIVPTRYSNRAGGGYRAYKKTKDLSGIPTLAESIVSGASAVSNRNRLIKNAPVIEIEVDQSLKNADKDIIPHPWVSNNLSGKTVVLLDPVSKVCEDILEIRSDPESSIEETNIIKNYINFGNSMINRSGPRDLTIVSARWR